MKHPKYKLVKISNDFTTNFKPYYMILKRSLFGRYKPLKAKPVLGYPICKIQHGYPKCIVETYDKDFALTAIKWLSINNINELLYLKNENIKNKHLSIHHSADSWNSYVFGRLLRYDYPTLGTTTDYIINADVNFFKQRLDISISNNDLSDFNENTYKNKKLKRSHKDISIEQIRHKREKNIIN